MNDVYKAIQKKFYDDATLMAKLPNNVPWFDPKKTASQRYSIIPAGLATTKTLTPFITIQQGVANKLGKVLRDESYYIRVYNAKIKSWVTINEIGERMIELLDEQIITLDSHVMVRAKYESSLATLIDETLDMNFREFRFRIFVL